MRHSYDRNLTTLLSTNCVFSLWNSNARPSLSSDISILNMKHATTVYISDITVHDTRKLHKIPHLLSLLVTSYIGITLFIITPEFHTWPSFVLKWSTNRNRVAEFQHTLKNIN